MDNNELVLSCGTLTVTITCTDLEGGTGPTTPDGTPCCQLVAAAVVEALMVCCGCGQKPPTNRTPRPEIAPPGASEKPKK